MFKDLKNTIKHTFIYSLSNLSIKLLGLILMPIYTNYEYVAREEYSVFALLEVTSQILIAVFGLALFQGFNRWYWDKNYKDKQKSLFFTILMASCFLVLLMYAALLPASGKISSLLLGNASYGYVFMIMVVVSGLQIIQNIPNTLLKLQSKSVYYSVMNIIKLVFVLGLTLFFVVVNGRGIRGIYEAQLISSIVYLITLSPYIRRNIKLVFEKLMLKEILTYCAPLMFASISGMLLSAFDRYCLSFMGYNKDVGIYANGFKIANTIKVVVIASVQLAINPLLYKKMNEEGNERFYSKVLTYFTYGIIMVVLFVSLFSYDILSILTVEKDYLRGLYVIPLISFGLLFGMMKDTVVIGLHINKKSKIIGKIIVGVAAINLVFNLIFIPIWGIIGASIATVISQILFFVIVYKAAQKEYHIDYEIKKILLMIFTGGLIYALSLLSSYMNIYVAAIYKLAIIALFPFCLYLFGFYEKVELERIRTGWNKWKDLSNFGYNIKNIKL